MLGNLAKIHKMHGHCDLIPPPPRSLFIWYIFNTMSQSFKLQLGLSDWKFENMV